MRSNFKTTTLMILTLALAACQARTVPVAEHEGPLENKIVQAPRTIEASARDLKSVDLSQMHSLVTKESDPKALAKSLNEISRFVMNGNYVENVEFSTTTELRNLLTYFNYGLKRLHQIAPEIFNEGGDGQKLLEVYEQVAFSNCDSELKGCKNVAFFRSDSGSASVLQLIAKKTDERIEETKVMKDGAALCEKECLTEIQRYYRLLAFASDIAPKGKDLEREFLYLKRAREYAVFYQDLGESQRNSAILQRHAKVFEGIISAYPANPKDPEFAKFVLAFSPWTYSHLEANPFPYGTKRMFNYAATHFLYTDATQTALTPGLIEALKSSQATGDKAGPSFKEIMRQLKEANPAIFNNLLDKKDRDTLETKDFYNEYFFIVDRLYRGHLEVDEAAQIWAGSARNQNKLLDTVEVYMKIQVLQMLEETNIYMRKIYQEGDFDGSTLVKEVVERSKEISDRWMQMHERFDYLSILLGRELKGKVSDSSRLGKTTTMVDSIRRNIKYLSVYPNMMLLSYFMSKAKGSLSFTTWYGKTFEVAPVTVVNTILDGRLAPWFRFGNNDESINHIEILYAYYFSLATGTFETFSKVDPNSGSKKSSSELPKVDRRLFLPEVIKLYMSTEQQELENGIRFLRQQLGSSSRLNAIERMCGYESANRTDYRIALNLEDFEKFALTGSGNASPIADVQDFYSNTLGPAVHIRVVRDNIDKKLIFVDTMVKLLLQNMAAQGSSAEEIKGMENYLNGELGRITQLKADYYNEAFSFHRKFSDCYTRLNNRERQRQKDLLRAEREHLGAIYEVMSALQSIADDEVQASIPAIIDRLKQEGKIPSQYHEWQFTEGLDRIDKNNYRYTKTELFLRMKARSERMQPAVYVNPIADLTRLGSYNVATMLPLRGTDANIMPKEEFIRNGMRMLNGYGSAYLKWMQETTTLEPLRLKLESMVQLYKLGFDPKLKLTDERRIKADEIITTSQELAAWAHIDDQETGILRDLGLNRRTSDRKHWDKILLDMSANEKKLSLLEYVYDAVRASDERLAEAREFANSVNTQGHFLFSPDEMVQKIMKENYRPLVDISEAIVADFEAAVAKAEARDAALIKSNPSAFQIRYELGDAVPSIYSPDLTTDGAPIYLDPLKKRDQENKMRRYHDELTDGFFKQKGPTASSGATK